jgi:calcineurin-like phosphoesterase family protein
MIAEWRAHVPDDATVVHLGDLCYKGNAFFKNIVAPELTGARKLLVRGNHDKGRFSFYRDCGFKMSSPFSIEYEPGAPIGAVAAMWRSPSRTTRCASPSSAEPHLHLHGHIHNNGYGGKDEPFTPFSAGQINLSVEQTKYRPVNLKRLLDGCLAVATGGLGVRRRRRPADRCPADGRVDRAWRAGLARTA